MLIIARLVGGIGIGMLTIVAPLLVETTPRFIVSEMNGYRYIPRSVLQKSEVHFWYYSNPILSSV